LHLLREELNAKVLLKSQEAQSGKAVGSDWDAKVQVMEKQLQDLENMLQHLAAQEARSSRRLVTVSHAELQAEIDRLKKAVTKMAGTHRGGGVLPPSGSEEAEEMDYSIPKKDDNAAAGTQEDGNAAAAIGEGQHDRRGRGHGRRQAGEEALAGDPNAPGAAPSPSAIDEAWSRGSNMIPNAGDVTAPVDYQGPPAGPPAAGDEGAGGNEGAARGAQDEAPGGRDLDVDTAMPYGDLEPFGREDTARELTEASIRESDAMVDQLERAEVAEEKRAIFRALTRLRGAAITSFDGVARAQTGNLDEYSRKNRWRRAHPLRHLAEEESDVSRWAFPDGSDF